MATVTDYKGRLYIKTTFGIMNIPFYEIDNSSGSNVTISYTALTNFYGDTFAGWTSPTQLTRDAIAYTSLNRNVGTVLDVIGKDLHHSLICTDVSTTGVRVVGGDNVNNVNILFAKGNNYEFGLPVMCVVPDEENPYYIFCLLRRTNSSAYEGAGVPTVPGKFITLSMTTKADSSANMIRICEGVNALDIMLNSETAGGDPYEQTIGESEPGMGNPDGDLTSEPIAIPGVPTLNICDTKFISLYTPTLSQLQSLAAYMWSTDFDLTTFRKLFADPMDCILGLTILPFECPHESGTRTITVGNVPTTVGAFPVSAQYFELNCGTIYITPFTGSYLDFEPYTKCDIFLPYIGMQSLSVDDIMNKQINVVYHIDVLTGACIAFIKCDDAVLYQFIGQCAANIPITSANFTNILSSLLDITRSLTHVASGGNALAGITGVAAASVNIFKPNIEKTGTLSGVGGFMGIQKPYIVLTKPNPAIPKDQNRYIGYPTYITRQISALSGYTEFEKIMYTNMTCTQDELAEIDRLMKEGVYL